MFTAIFTVFGFTCLIIGFLLEGGHITALFGAPPFIIVVGGTIGATGMSVPFYALKEVGKAMMVAFKEPKVDVFELIEYFEELSVKARKEGVLALEPETTSDDVDPFIRKGLTLVMDGVNQDQIKLILEEEVQQLSERHESRIKIFDSAGGYSPTLGIVGTVMGLVHILADLSSPETLGPKIANAFLATLYGIGFANLIFLPISARLKALNEQEVSLKCMMIEVVLSIAAGDNYMVMLEKIKSFLNPKQVSMVEESQ